MRSRRRVVVTVRTSANAVGLVLVRAMGTWAGWMWALDDDDDDDVRGWRGARRGRLRTTRTRRSTLR